MLKRIAYGALVALVSVSVSVAITYELARRQQRAMWRKVEIFVSAAVNAWSR